jgi:hypothetical protein
MPALTDFAGRTRAGVRNPQQELKLRRSREAFRSRHIAGYKKVLKHRNRCEGIEGIIRVRKATSHERQ